LPKSVLPETCLDVKALSDRLSEIEAERLRLHQKIEQALKKRDTQQITSLLRRLSALTGMRSAAHRPC
jgi:hypothetical protein